MELRNQVVDAFCKEPEIYGIYAFGREVDGTADRYSDLDLIICSNDLEATQKKYRDILGTIFYFQSLALPSVSFEEIWICIDAGLGLLQRHLCCSMKSILDGAESHGAN